QARGPRPGGDRRPFNRDDRPGGGYRDDRGGERRPYGDRDNRGGERRPYGDRDRPSYDRGDRGDRGGAFRGEGEGSRTRYSRNQEPGERGETPANAREELPAMAPDITAEELDKEVREELSSLPLDLADLVSRHLVAAERALGEDEAEQAYEHTKVARRFAARIGVVREAVGIAAYRAGHFAEALSDLRAARRMTGSDSFLPVMADCERGLGRPERALDLARSKEAERLDRAGKIELAIVESGARRDLHQKDAAVITLQRLPELRDTRPHPWSARLAFAYADALADAGHEEAATEWFGRAMAFDEDGETDAAERYAELTGTIIDDIEDLENDEDLDLDGLDADEVSDLPEAEDEGIVVETVMIDDAAVLDAEIEAEDDLQDLEPVGDLAAGEPLLGEAELKPEGEEDKVTERIEPGVGPAFIEPDFGDTLGDSPADDDDDVTKDEKKK
ncbi:hypothetical protein, partial [Streptosporangium sp. NPDC049376]|uniref:hypothetical protein n=1 Tax=Streptosporangium sp. NPDC049376 TaxID=3366192 RepID=UPI0037BB8118